MLKEIDLEKYRLTTAPCTLYYIPNFINEAEERQLADQINSVPKPKWTQLSNRRLQNWGGVLSAKGSLIQDQMPTWLNEYCERLSGEGIFEGRKPNHVLINEYLPNQGIMPHTDGPAYYPIVCTISIVSHIVLDYYKTLNDDMLESSGASLDNRYLFSLLVEPRSMYILEDEMYTSHLHGIRDTGEDVIDPAKMINYNQLGNPDGYKPNEIVKRDKRVSLTIRHVQNVSKINPNKLLFKK